MRTKVLLCAVALAASLASSMAQNVYSLNVVGYYNVTVPAGQFTLIANQLNTTNNQIQYLLPSVTSGATLYKYASGGFASTVFSVGRSGPPGSWDQPTLTLNPGETALLLDPAADTITFVGTVLEGTLTNSVTFPPGAIAFASSVVPVQGRVTADLGMPAESGDTIYLMEGGAYNPNVFSVGRSGPPGSWDSADPGGPVLNVGQGFAYVKAATAVTNQWVVSFTVQ
jgi:hypothetical protein